MKNVAKIVLGHPNCRVDDELGIEYIYMSTCVSMYVYICIYMCSSSCLSQRLWWKNFTKVPLQHCTKNFVAKWDPHNGSPPSGLGPRHVALPEFSSVPEMTRVSQRRAEDFQHQTWRAPYIYCIFEFI